MPPVNQMDQVTQQNAAMVEETTAASMALRSESDTLRGLVAKFQVNGASAPGSALRAAAQPCGRLRPNRAQAPRRLPTAQHRARWRLQEAPPPAQTIGKSSKLVKLEIKKGAADAASLFSFRSDAGETLDQQIERSRRHRRCA